MDKKERFILFIVLIILIVLLPIAILSSIIYFVMALYDIVCIQITIDDIFICILTISATVTLVKILKGTVLIFKNEYFS